MREISLAAVEYIDARTCCLFFGDGTKKYVVLAEHHSLVLTLLHRLYSESVDITRRMGLWSVLALCLVLMFSHYALAIVLIMFCLWGALKLIAWLLNTQLFPNRLVIYALIALHTQENSNDLT